MLTLQILLCNAKFDRQTFLGTTTFVNVLTIHLDYAIFVTDITKSSTHHYFIQFTNVTESGDIWCTYFVYLLHTATFVSMKSKAYDI